MKRLMIGLAAVAAVVWASGCASIIATSTLDSADRAAAVKAVQGIDGKPVLAVDFAQINTGYFAQWAKHPFVMTGATALDIGTGVLAYKAYQKNVLDKGSSDTATPGSGAAAGSVVLTGNNGTFVINTGSGSASQDTGNTSGP